MSHDELNRVPVDHLQGVPETLLPVLYARVVEARRPDGIIRDPVAMAWVERIAYDFSRFDQSHLSNFGVAVRTEILDELTQAHLRTHPGATVVNLGAGLDTRFFRMDNGQVRWFELDLPESITVRRQLIDESDRHRFIAASALDPAWFDLIEPASAPLFIAEGLLMYFSESDARDLLGAIVARWPTATFLVEVLGHSQAQRTDRNDAISHTSARFQWGIRDATQMGGWHPSLTYVTDISIFDRYPERWLALPANWSASPAELRHTVDRIVHLRGG